MLLPGVYGTDDLLVPMLDAAPPNVHTRIITYPTHQAMSFAEHVEWVRQRLPTDQPYVLVAESFAGPLAITLADEQPPLLRGLVLCNTYTKRPGAWGFLLLPLWLMTLVCSLPLPAWMRRRYLVGADDPMTRPVKAAERKTSPRVYAKRFHLALRTDVTDAFRRLDLPILCLLGTRDRLVDPRPLRKLAQNHPRAATHTFDAPHMLLQLQPAACWQAITTFTAEL